MGHEGTKTRNAGHEGTKARRHEGAVAILLCAVLAAAAARAVSSAETAASILARNLQARGVDQWKTFYTMRLRGTVTSRGKPVATITAADQVERRERVAAKRALLSRLRACPAVGARNWSRDELYD